MLAVDFEVSGETLQRTDKCWRSFACLSSDEEIVCPVRDYISGVLFVARKAETYCPYDVTFGYSHICSCPVRREIHKRYDQ